jgi:Tol biopolymer transport system component
MNSGEAVRVTNLPNTPSSVTWSPNGEQLAYSVLVAGEKPKIGTALTKPEGAQWAPALEVIDTITYRSDGQGYLKPGFRHVFVVSAQGGGARQLTHGDFHHGGGLSWSADSRTVYLSANRRADWQRESANSEIYALDVQTGGLTALTDRAGPDNAPVASPDGRRIAYLGYDDKRMGYHNTRLHVMDADGSNRRVLTANLDRSVSSPVWSHDGRSVYVAYDDQGRTKVARVSMDGAVTPLIEDLTGDDFGRPYTGGDFSVADDGAIAYTAIPAARPTSMCGKPAATPS